MKYLLVMSSLCVSMILIGTSCQKQPLPGNQEVLRKVQFLLYTNKDFSHNNGLITFKPFIQNLRGQVLWDSVLAPRRIHEIAGPANKLLIEKLLYASDTALLKVGFYYSIENVGLSWYIDSFRAGETFKIVDFNFQ